MKYERLVIEAGEHTFALDLHPRLTVVGGVGQLERDGLVTELIGSLGSGRSGVHLELVSDGGGRFAVFRPHGAPHRVVDVDGAVDVTAQFTDPSGRVDLLGRVGLDVRTARATMRCTASDLMTPTERDHLIGRLAQINQNELWLAADALRHARAALDEEATSVGSSAEDAEVIERIERRHADFERHQAHAERIRRATYLLAGFAALGVVPVTIRFGRVAALPLVALAALSVVVSLVSWRRALAAQRAEESALAEAGAQSYLGFHLQRVNGLLSSDQARKRLMQAADEHRAALRRWSVIAGDVDVDWALRHRSQIDDAVRIRQEITSSGRVPTGTGNGEQAAELAHAVGSRLAELRRLADGTETFPAIFDEPFGDIDPELRPALLELLVRSAEHQQIILLTADELICSWARLEAMTGELSLVEPARAIVDLDAPTPVVQRT